METSKITYNSYNNFIFGLEVLGKIIYLTWAAAVKRDKEHYLIFLCILCLLKEQVAKLRCNSRCIRENEQKSRISSLSESH